MREEKTSRCRSKNGSNKLGHRRLVNKRDGCNPDSRLFLPHPDCGRQSFVSEFESRDQSTIDEETPLSRMSAGDTTTQSGNVIEAVEVQAPEPDLSVQVEAAIMNDISNVSKRMKECDVSKKKSRKGRFAPLKRFPLTVYKAFRGFVQSNKQPPQTEKPKSVNLPVVCFNERFHLPFNLVPTVEATKDKSTTIICPGLNEAITFPFYFGNIDRHEAANILAGLEHGYFLLRDSFHPDFRFAVSFRCSSATVHARIQTISNGRYTFKMDDSLRFSSHNLLDFLTHYNYVERYVLDEPYLMKPVNRKNPFSLQFLCTALIASRCTPKGVESLPIPESIKQNIFSSFCVV